MVKRNFPELLTFATTLLLLLISSNIQGLNAFPNALQSSNQLDSLINAINEETTALEDDSLEFTNEDEESLVEDLIEQGVEDFLESQVDDERQLQELRHHAPGAGLGSRSKRFTVEFNGMQVSYPTYIRLNRMREKAIKLQKILKALSISLPPEERGPGSDFQRLLALYTTLKPLLPKDGEEYNRTGELIIKDGVEEKRAVYNEKEKRFTVPFQGMSVTLPQYMRLKSLQDKAVRLDMVMQKMSNSQSIENLNRIPKWHSLVELHAGLKHMLPEDYQPGDFTATLESADHEEMLALSKGTARTPSTGERTKRSTKPGSRLGAMQKSVLRLDAIMRQMVNELGLDQLRTMPKWYQLVELRESMQNLLPEDHPAFDARRKKGLTMDFNGMDVSYTQYVHLKALQKKVERLDDVMSKIRAAKPAAALASDPQWKKLSALRKSLVKILPMI